jgi:hypothetical protein
LSSIAESTPIEQLPESPGGLPLLLSMLHARSRSTASSCQQRDHALPLYPAAILKQVRAMKVPKWLFRAVAAVVLGGQVVVRICQGAPGLFADLQPQYQNDCSELALCMHTACDAYGCSGNAP